MNVDRAITVALLLMGSALMAGAVGTKAFRSPIVVTAADPDALTGPDVMTEVVNGRTSKNRPIGLSVDESFASGLYAAPAGTGSIDSYPVDEFMYFVNGDMVMTSTDGTVIRLKAGDAVHVARGWKGTWATSGYTKLYVVHDADKAH